MKRNLDVKQQGSSKSLKTASGCAAQSPNRQTPRSPSGHGSRLKTISANILLLSGGSFVGPVIAQSISFTTTSTIDIGATTRTAPSLLVSNGITGTLTGVGGTLVYSGGAFSLGGTANATQQTLNMAGLSNFVSNNPTRYSASAASSRGPPGPGSPRVP
jgi:hypothetical protein